MQHPTREIIEIDEGKCDGCGQCVTACAEGAIQLVDGKARLVKDSYCDGLGACLGECPRDAIKIIERAADPFDADAVAQHQSAPRRSVHLGVHAADLASGIGGAGARHAAGHGCPGSAMRTMQPAAGKGTAEGAPDGQPPPSMLQQWPVQLMLVPPHAPFLRNADLVVCADCVPFTIPDFHPRYLSGRAVVVGCPKLDDLELYARKLAEMFRTAEPSRVTVVRMEVPCCSGLSRIAVQAALQEGMSFPLEEHVVGVQGGVVERVLR